MVSWLLAAEAINRQIWDRQNQYGIEKGNQLRDGAGRVSAVWFRGGIKFSYLKQIQANNAEKEQRGNGREVYDSAAALTAQIRYRY